MITAMPRPEEIFPAVREDYARYELFLNRSKPLEANSLTLTPSSCGKHCRLEPRLELDASGIPFSLHVDVSLKNIQKYAFKLFAPDFGQAPCFRFDTVGTRPHVNEEDGRGLAARSIPHPHFHKVSGDGIMRAYQTDPLRDPTSQKMILDDINHGGVIFFDETRITPVSPQGVAIRYYSDQLIPPSNDPLEGVAFN